MAKLHRKAANGRRMKKFVRESSMAGVSAGNEAATALDEWEAEGGSSVAAGGAGENDALPQSPLDRLLLERLGVALVGEWSNLPTRLQRTVYERAVCLNSPLHRSTIRRQMARFLHEHNHRARRAPSAQAAPVDTGQGTARHEDRP